MDTPELLDCGHRKDLARGIAVLGSLRGKRICAACDDRRKRALYKPKVLRRERQPLRIGFTTLVGVMPFAEPAGSCPECGHDHVVDPRCSRWGDGVTAVCMVNECRAKIPVKDPFPLKHGNCCGILNMNTENAEEARRRWPELAEDCEVEIVEVGGRERVRVVDPRLPVEWKTHHCSGCGIYEGDVEPIPYPDQESEPPATSVIYAPYVPVDRRSDFTIYQWSGESKKMNTKWSSEGPDEANEEQA